MSEPQAKKDLDFRTDFDAEGNCTNPDLIKQFAESRKRLLGAPVGSTGKPIEAAKSPEEPTPTDTPSTAEKPATDAANAKAPDVKKP